jgi:hypothetical protein
LRSPRFLAGSEIKNAPAGSGAGASGGVFGRFRTDKTTQKRVFFPVDSEIFPPHLGFSGEMFQKVHNM